MGVGEWLWTGTYLFFSDRGIKLSRTFCRQLFSITMSVKLWRARSKSVLDLAGAARSHQITFRAPCLPVWVESIFPAACVLLLTCLGRWGMECLAPRGLTPAWRTRWRALSAAPR